METVIIVIHLMVVLALIAVILVQRSEGGALGIGGGGGNIFSARGTANILTRATTILAVVFFATTIALTILARQDAVSPSILDQLGTTDSDAPPVPVGGATRGSGSGILDQLPTSPSLGGEPSVPTGETGTVPVPGAAAPSVPTGDGSTVPQPGGAAPGGPSVPVGN